MLSQTLCAAPHPLRTSPLQSFLRKLLTVDLPALMVLPKRLEVNIPPSVTSIAEAAVGRDTIMRAVASAVLQADAVEQALLAALPLGPQTPAGGVTLPEAFRVGLGEMLHTCLCRHHVAQLPVSVECTGLGLSAGLASQPPSASTFFVQQACNLPASQPACHAPAHEYFASCVLAGQGELDVVLREARNLPVWGFPGQSNPYARMLLGEQVG
jgi:hypothetical protein